jgi:hypothetical protein
MSDLIPVGERVVFMSPYQYGPDTAPDLTKINGSMVTITGHIEHADEDHDEEVLPMYRVTFDSGLEIEAWPEEVEHA